MDEERNAEAVIGEFFADDEQMERQIVEEWNRAYEEGEEIMFGDASESIHARWYLDFSGPLRAALTRLGFPEDAHDEDSP